MPPDLRSAAVDCGVCHFIVALRDPKTGKLTQLDFGPVGGDIAFARQTELASAAAASGPATASMTLGLPAGQQPQQLKGTPGEVRERGLEQLPQHHLYVGSTRLSLEEIRAFNNMHHMRYDLHHNDCRHYVNRLVRHVTGFEHASQQLLRHHYAAKVREDLRCGRLPWHVPIVHLGQYMTDFKNWESVRRMGQSAAAALTALVSWRLAKLPASLRLRGMPLPQQLRGVLPQMLRSAVAASEGAAAAAAAAGAGGAGAAAPGAVQALLRSMPQLLSEKLSNAAAAAAAALPAAEAGRLPLQVFTTKLTYAAPVIARCRRQLAARRQRSLAAGAGAAPAGAAAGAYQQHPPSTSSTGDAGMATTGEASSTLLSYYSQQPHLSTPAGSSGQQQYQQYEQAEWVVVDAAGCSCAGTGQLPGGSAGTYQHLPGCAFASAGGNASAQGPAAAAAAAAAAAGPYAEGLQLQQPLAHHTSQQQHSGAAASALLLQQQPAADASAATAAAAGAAAPSVAGVGAPGALPLSRQQQQMASLYSGLSRISFLAAAIAHATSSAARSTQGWGFARHLAARRNAAATARAAAAAAAAGGEGAAPAAATRGFAVAVQNAVVSVKGAAARVAQGVRRASAPDAAAAAAGDGAAAPQRMWLRRARPPLTEAVTVTMRQPWASRAPWRLGRFTLSGFTTGRAEVQGGAAAGAQLLLGAAALSTSAAAAGGAAGAGACADVVPMLPDELMALEPMPLASAAGLTPPPSSFGAQAISASGSGRQGMAIINHPAASGADGTVGAHGKQRRLRGPRFFTCPAPIVMVRMPSAAPLQGPLQVGVGVGGGVGGFSGKPGRGAKQEQPLALMDVCLPLDCASDDDGSGMGSSSSSSRRQASSTSSSIGVGSMAVSKRRPAAAAAAAAAAAVSQALQQQAARWYL